MFLDGNLTGQKYRDNVIAPHVVPRRLITVRVLMWPPNAKLPRSASAVLNGRCRARLDINRSSLGVVLQGIPAHGRSVTFPV
jgi:hypothetical protein